MIWNPLASIITKNIWKPKCTPFSFIHSRKVFQKRNISGRERRKNFLPLYEKASVYRGRESAFFGSHCDPVRQAGGQACLVQTRCCLTPLHLQPLQSAAVVLTLLQSLFKLCFPKLGHFAARQRRLAQCKGELLRRVGGVRAHPPTPFMEIIKKRGAPPLFFP